MVKLIVLLLAVLTSGISQAAERVALVLGNADYADRPLRNPHNDAADMAKLLREQLGFSVITGTDRTLRQTRQLVREFIRASRDAKIRLFYYSGHGTRYLGESYLVPIKHGIAEDYEIPDQAYRLQTLLRGLDGAGPGTNLIFLDACRDQPFGAGKNLGSKGLAPVSAGAGTLIAYAAQPGQTASDNPRERNGLFTKYLLEQLTEPGEISQLITQVRRKVYQQSPEQQLPETSNSLLEPVYLRTATAAPPVSIPTPRPAPIIEPQQVRLAVKATPPNALVRIMNIVPAYRDGIELEPGRYDIEVSAAGYETYREWHELTVGDQVLPITLASMVPPSPPADQTGKVIRDRLRDGSTGPEMVFIRGGRFQMGSPLGEAGRDDDERQHEVSVGDFYIGKYEVTVGEFRRFVTVTGYRTDAEKDTGNVDGCYTLDRDDKDKSWTWREWADWKTPNKYLANQDSHPVSCVSWNDAVAYIEWLNAKRAAGTPEYRLPKETEWEYAARGGTTTARYWGESADAACAYANVTDQTRHEGRSWTEKHDCSDGYYFVAPVGQFKANAWNLHDMLGNVWEWTCSEYDEGYGGAESECTSKNNASARRVYRGGSWITVPSRVRSANRGRDTPDYRLDALGFRLARLK